MIGCKMKYKYDSGLDFGLSGDKIIKNIHNWLADGSKLQYMKTRSLILV